jgi:acetyl esterase
VRHLVEASSQRFVAIEYRLAPEHRFPAGLLDAEAALRWTLDHAGELGGAPGRVGIGGDSAGATLALVAALECARADRSPAFQVLCYPSLGPELMSESHHDFDHDFGLTADDMAYFYEQYLPAGQSHADPRVSPLLTPDLQQAPATILSVAGFDPLRDEGLALGGLLEGSGVQVELLDEPSLVHGFLCLGGIDAGRAALARLGAAIARASAG